jgi:hypothetical protein
MRGRKRLDLQGKIFGRLTVLSYAGRDKGGCSMWRCQCSCGNIRNIRTLHLVKGNVVSCGCYHREKAVKTMSKTMQIHGKSDTRLYSIWTSMKARCLNKNNKIYPRYGGRGIVICSEWLIFENFYQWAINNGYQDGLSIDRIDNGEGYYPNNCGWVNATVQANNTRSNRRVTCDGETHTIAEWSRIVGISGSTLRHRLFDLGWNDIHRALYSPVTKAK